MKERKKKPTTLWIDEDIRSAISRYQHQFKEEVGIPISTHKLMEMALLKALEPFLAAEAVTEDLM